MQEFEGYAGLPHEDLSSQDCQQWTRTEFNLGYLVDLIEPKVLQLQLFEAFQKTLTFKSVMKAYRLYAQKMRSLENHIVPTYNSETKLSKVYGVQWNKVEGKWELISDDLED